MKDTFIFKLIQHFEKSNSVFLHIKDGENELTLKKEGAFHTVSPVSVGFPANPAQNAAVLSNAVPVSTALPNGVPQSVVQNGAASVAASASAAPAAAPTAQAAQNAGTDANTVTVKSPIVGTFYRSPSPDAPAYVEKGSTVHKGQPLCVLEAMKMMNTLECEYDGVVEDVLAANGDLVEFDQPLFVIRKK